MFNSKQILNGCEEIGVVGVATDGIELVEKDLEELRRLSAVKRLEYRVARR